MGYQRFTFPLVAYGCMDSASRKLFWLRVWTNSCDPKLVARWYFDYLYERRIIASIIRIDKGTETGDMTWQLCMHICEGIMETLILKILLFMANLHPIRYKSISSQSISK